MRRPRATEEVRNGAHPTPSISMAVNSIRPADWCSPNALLTISSLAVVPNLGGARPFEREPHCVLLTSGVCGFGSDRLCRETCLWQGSPLGDLPRYGSESDATAWGTSHEKLPKSNVEALSMGSAKCKVWPKVES